MSDRTIIDVLRSRVGDSSPAYGFDNEQLSFGELADAAGRLATALAQGGLQRGDRCALVVPAGLELIRLVYAVQWLGAAPVVINPDQPAGRIDAGIEMTQCKRVVDQPIPNCRRC